MNALSGSDDEFIFEVPVERPLEFRKVVRANKSSKDELMDELRSLLHLPDYFGRNWDALEECLRDLGWLPEGRVILIHHDLPLADDRKNLVVYLSILKEAVLRSRERARRELVVVFPKELESTIDEFEMSNALAPDEAEVIGHWFMRDGRMHGDDACERIETLTREYLEHVAVDENSGAWATLFRDPRDGRYWERTYPQGHMHGGGPPSLRVLSPEDVRAKYPKVLSAT